MSSEKSVGSSAAGTGTRLAAMQHRVVAEPAGHGDDDFVASVGQQVRARARSHRMRPESSRCRPARSRVRVRRGGHLRRPPAPGRSLDLYAYQSTDLGSSCARMASMRPGRAISCGLPKVKSSASGSCVSACMLEKYAVTRSTDDFALTARSDIAMLDHPLGPLERARGQTSKSGIRRQWGTSGERGGRGNEETPSCRSQERVSVAPTGVDPVTSRFSVVRSTN